MGAGELDTQLHPTLAYWREIGKALVVRACGALDPTNLKSLVVPEPASGELAAFAQAVPPMRGAELITFSMLGELWNDIGKALATEAARSKDALQGYLSTSWQKYTHIF